MGFEEIEALLATHSTEFETLEREVYPSFLQQQYDDLKGSALEALGYLHKEGGCFGQDFR